MLGIGLALVRRLIASGHKVHTTFHKTNAPPDLGVSVQPFDALNPAASKLVWPEILDGLVYCPGTITLKPFPRLSTSDFQTDFQVNVFGAIAALQSALPALKKSSSPSVVLYSTIAVSQGMPFHASIASSKGAVEGLTRSLAAEWAPLIRVNAIAPSLTNTPLAGTMLNSAAKTEAASKRHPLSRVGQPDEVAALTEYLLSDSSQFMTGQVLHVDGGLSSVRLFN